MGVDLYARETEGMNMVNQFKVTYTFSEKAFEILLFDWLLQNCTCKSMELKLNKYGKQAVGIDLIQYGTDLKGYIQ